MSLEFWPLLLAAALGFLLGWLSGYTYQSLGRH